MLGKRTFRLGLIFGFMMLLWLGQVMPAAAAGTRGVSFSLGCTGFTSNGSIIQMNRDNTGRNQESFTITAYDGYGQVIYGPQTSSLVLGGGFVIPAGQFGQYSQAPTANPLIITVTSNGGNGLGEQIVYRRSGNCPLLTEEGDFAPQLVGLPDLNNIDGTTSPSVPVNQVPPTPPGLNGIAQFLDLPGYGIVNTSRLNMRTGAGVQYSRIAILNGATELIILGRNPAETWWYVQVDDLRGWVSGEFIALRGDVRGAHIVPGQGELEPARFVYYNDYPLYTGPTTLASATCNLTRTVENEIVGRTNGSDWYQVRTVCNGASVTGWVQASLGAVRTSGAVRIPITG